MEPRLGLWNLSAREVVNLTGYQPAELINNSKVIYNQLIHPDEWRKSMGYYQAALKEHKPFQLTYRIKTADGETKWVIGTGTGHIHFQRRQRGK